MEKKDNIEKLILDNIETLNDNEPMEGHFARFEAKLNEQHKKKRTIKTYSTGSTTHLFFQSGIVSAAGHHE